VIEHTYFGWSQLTHTDPCPAPSWDIDVRHDAGIRPHADRAVTHGCPDQHCTHDSDFGRVTVRVICRGCDTAHVITGESLTRTTTVTAALGYGQAPRQIAGLYLWPGRPVLHGWGSDDRVRQYLVTAELVDRLAPEHCVGSISGHFNAAGDRLWIASATAAALVPPRSPLDGSVPRLAFARRACDLASIEDAAAWIAAAIDPAQQQPLVVAV
jgi:hypothetical protein